MNRPLNVMTYLLLALLGLSTAWAVDGDWPRTVTLDEGTVTIYEPQVDEMTDDFIRFRAALAWRENPGDEPVFGAGWFESDVQVNRLAGTVHPVALRVTQTRFPVEADVQTALSRAMAEPSFASNFTFSLAALESSAEATQAEAQAAERLKTDPPTLYYRDRPALLVSIDGKPVLREIENSDYRAVINTPYPLITDGRWYYLNAARDVWYRSDKATGPFRFTGTVPEPIAALVKSNDESTEDADAAAEEKVTAANAPEVIVSTEPAELIVTDGPAAFVPLVDDLLVLNNSDDDVFLHLGEQAYYIVLAGRWYRATSLDGPWAYRDSDELPSAFARIPEHSEQADSRVYVAGTEEAEEAVLDAQVPQTAAVKRGEVEIEVEYDGDPVFAPVDGTDMSYATNTGSTVLLADGRYYMVEDGVWYVSSSFDGPWQVAVARPDQVRVILPSSPVYNVKYVYVYDVTPQVVYVGYTPGYIGSYVYGSTVFYGSGWYYRPWVSARWYYPYHRTWGFHVSYDPWYGWNFGLSWAWGPFSFSFWPGGYWHHHHYWYHDHYSYWGPHGYRPRYRPYPPYHRPPGHYRPPGHGGGYRPRPYERHHNLYADARQRARVVDTYDNPPRAFDRRRGDGEFVGRAHARAGFDRNGAVAAKNAAFTSSKPMSKSELSKKARSNPAGPAASRARSGGGEAMAYSARPASPKAQLSRNELAGKAKQGEQRFKASRNAGTGTGNLKSAGRSIDTPARKLSRADLGRYTAGESRSKAKNQGATAKKALQSSAGRNSYTVASASAKKPPARSVKKPVVSAGGKSAVTAVPRAKPGSGSPGTKQYSRSAAMPRVKLTAPSKQRANAAMNRSSPSGSAGRSAPRAPAPSVAPQPRSFNQNRAPQAKSFSQNRALAPASKPQAKPASPSSRSKQKQRYE